MALETHIEFLKQKHARFSRMVHEAESHPGSDDLEIHRLKAQRLSVKDEIMRLQGRIAA